MSYGLTILMLGVVFSIIVEYIASKPPEPFGDFLYSIQVVAGIILLKCFSYNFLTRVYSDIIFLVFLSYLPIWGMLISLSFIFIFNIRMNKV